MGYDSISHLPQGTRFSEVEEFLGFLGYQRIKRGWFLFFEYKDYLSITGVTATIEEGENGKILVFLHSNIFASKTDIEQFNLTAKQLRKRFGGSFRSDFGKGKYIREDVVEREKAEAGCYQAYTRFENNISTVNIYIRYAKFEVQFPPLGEFSFIDQFNPSIISNNLVLPFLVSIVEDFYKSCYIALLKYSDKKENILKNSRLFPEDLYKISNQEFTVEEAVGRTRSFQNVEKIVANFKEVDRNLDLYGVLNRPYRRRKETLFSAMDKLFEQRHLLIHQNLIRPDYTKEQLKRDINNVEVIVKRSYQYFIDTYGWHPF